MSTEGTDRDEIDRNKDSEGTGPEGTIPESDDGVAVGAMDEPNQFEPEEDGGHGS